MILGIVGLQNTGKTTLLEHLIPRITQAGFKVATVKHIAHDDLQIDVAGTDTNRHKKAGSRLSVAVSDSETVYFHPRPHRLAEVLDRMARMEPTDLILVEGFKGSVLPKIVIGNADHGGPALYRWDGTAEGARGIAEKIVEALVEESFGRAIDGEGSTAPTDPQTRLAAKVEPSGGSTPPAAPAAADPGQPEVTKRARRFFRKG